MHKPYKPFRDILLLVAISVFSLLCFGLIPLLHIDSSTEVFIPKDAAVTKINEEIKQDFGSQDSFLLGVKTKYGTVLEPEVLELISKITTEIEALPSVSQVVSLSNAQYLANSDDSMQAVPLLPSMDAAGLTEFRKHLTDWQEMYVGTLLSKDLQLAAIIIQPDKAASPFDHERIYASVQQIVAKYQSENLEFPIAGLPVVKKEIKQSLINDIIYLIPIAALIILLVLFFSFRSASGIIMPIVSLVISIAPLIAVMALMKITFTMATLLVPVLLLVVGSAYSIHVVSHFYHDVGGLSGHVDSETILRIIKQGAAKVRLPVMMAGATTAAGFLSQLTSPLEPFRTFGVLSALGVVLSQLSSLIIVPALLRLRYGQGYTPVPDKKSSRKTSGDTDSRFEHLGQKAVKLFWPSVLVSAVLLFSVVVSLPGVKTGTNMIEFFLPSSRMVKDTKKFNDSLSGSSVLSVLIRSPEKSAILDPVFLKRLEEFEILIAKNPDVGHVQTITGSLKRMNKIMNYSSVPYQSNKADSGSLDLFGMLLEDESGASSESGSSGLSVGALEPESSLFEFGESIPAEPVQDLGSVLSNGFLDAGPGADAQAIVKSILRDLNYEGEAFNEIPVDPAKYGMETTDDLKNMLSQFLVLYSGNLDMMINDSLEPDKTLVTIQTRTEDRAVLMGLKKDISGFWKQYLDPSWTFEVAGPAALSLALSELVLQSQFWSLFAALAIVWLIVSVMFRSAVAGFYGLIPVGFALAGIFVSMSLFHINLDIVTSLLASLAIGIGVDYAIHFMNAYIRHGAGLNPSAAGEVYRATGKAIAVNAASVGLGFLSLLLSRFIPIRQMGLLFCVSMLFAGVSSLTVLPALLYKFRPSFIRREHKNLIQEEI